MHHVLFDDEASWKNLLPLTFTRPIPELRIGILTIKQKWDRHLHHNCHYLSQPHLEKKFPFYTGEGCYINSTLCPDEMLLAAIAALQPGEGLYANGLLLAFKGQASQLKEADKLRSVPYTGTLLRVENVWDIFQKNAEALKRDFDLLTKGRQSQPLSKTVTVVGNAADIFLEKGAKAEACIINTTGGPVYLGEDSEIMEGSAVRGPFALCEHSTLKLCTKVYGASTVGPHSKVGGELSNSVIFGYSNKAHDGFLGNSVIGEWCNLGADTNNSNLKNNYSNVKLYNYLQQKQVDTGLQFCGLIMGDHSRSGINTMFNTGTVVGVGCNIYGGGFPPTHIPSFSWGGAEGFDPYKTEKLFETASRVFSRRSLAFDSVEQELLTELYKDKAGRS